MVPRCSCLLSRCCVVSDDFDLSVSDNPYGCRVSEVPKQSRWFPFLGFLERTAANRRCLSSQMQTLRFLVRYCRIKAVFILKFSSTWMGVSLFSTCAQRSTVQQKKRMSGWRLSFGIKAHFDVLWFLGKHTLQWAAFSSTDDASVLETSEKVWSKSVDWVEVFSFTIYLSEALIEKAERPDVGSDFTTFIPDS